MKFYLASRLSNAEKALQAIRHLESLGHECTCNWSSYYLKNGPTVGKSLGHRLHHANRELNGVRDADFVVGLFPIAIGSSIEIGGALILNKTVYLVGKPDPYDIHFFDLVKRRYDRIEEISDEHLLQDFPER